jgi:acetyl esterase/lipase
MRLAELGFTVIGVEFRNAAGRLGPHRFPAGLNDCMASLEYVFTNKKELNIDKIILLGESGGANLCLSLALLARQRHVQHWIDGVYGLCPYIYGDYDYLTKDDPTPKGVAASAASDVDAQAPFPLSLRENDGLLLPRCRDMHALALLYLPEGEKPSDHPLAWPYHTSLASMQGLPPHVISVNELDPCRDEALEYCDRLMEAGVSARSRVVEGTCHAGELLFMKFIPDVFAATLQDVLEFSEQLQWLE